MRPCIFGQVATLHPLGRVLMRRTRRGGDVHEGQPDNAIQIGGTGFPQLLDGADLLSPRTQVVRAGDVVGGEAGY